MNAVELYKRLPGTNCGKCRMAKCMPFALSVLRGESDVSECPSMDPEAVLELQGKIRTSDWREDLIADMMREVGRISFEDIAGGIGAGLQDGALVIPCMGRDYRVYTDGRIETHGHITPWMKILLLHYIRTHGNSTLSGSWVSYSDLKSGMIKASSFLRECEEPLQTLLDSRFEDVASSFDRVGAEKRKGFPTEHAWHIMLLPKVPVIVLYWPAEEEFSSKVRVLFDSTADRFLDVESIMFLVEGLVKNIEMLLNRKP